VNNALVTWRGTGIDTGNSGGARRGGCVARGCDAMSQDSGQTDLRLANGRRDMAQLFFL
jgi:hypothetical protein